MNGKPSLAIANPVADMPLMSDVRDYWRLLKPNVMSLVVFSAGVGLYLAPGTLHPVIAAIAILCIAASSRGVGCDQQQL